jgi:hypothetical protein
MIESVTWLVTGLIFLLIGLIMVSESSNNSLLKRIVNYKSENFFNLLRIRIKKKGKKQLLEYQKARFFTIGILLIIFGAIMLLNGILLLF